MWAFRCIHVWWKHAMWNVARIIILNTQSRYIGIQSRCGNRLKYVKLISGSIRWLWCLTLRVPHETIILKEYSVTNSESVWCLTLHVPHETIILKEYSVLFASKPNTQELLFCAMKTYWSVLEYATLAINIALLQHSHLKPDTLDRKGRILWAKSRLIFASLL